MSQPSWIGYNLGGRYRIEEKLGQGGMSTVFRATDPNLRRTVAVKLIHAHLTGNNEFVRRFEEEAAAVARLRHPNIIQVFDFNHDSDTYYMVLEYVPGETLQQRLMVLNAAAEQMPLTDVIRIGASIADAVDYAHQRGMIHRDIKPANIMLDPNGQAILMDFGIAKIIGGEQHTATGAVVGTALYMSPEQAMGDVPTTRSDIYSLGVTLFEMAGGHPPYDADSAMSIMMMHINDPVPDLRQFNPNVPEGLKRVIERALSKDPAERYRSGTDLAAALRGVSISATQPVQAANATVIEPPPQPEPRSTYIESTPPPVAPSPDRFSADAMQPDWSAPPPAYTGGGYPPPPPESKAQGGRRPNRSMMLVGGGVAVVALIACLIGAAFLGGRFLNTDQTNSTATSPAETAETEEVAAATEEATSEPTATEPVPTEVLTPTLTPTETVPPGKYVRINNITLEGNSYVVEYETFEYTEQLPGDHVHFFFNTVAPENAGMPGSGPWILYGGPRPFTQYTVAQRPQAATQMCALVANPDHSIILNTGNCFDLPDS